MYQRSWHAGLLATVLSQQEVNNQTAVAGISTNINIGCNLNRQQAAPFWRINNTVYELFSISCTFLPAGVIPVVDSYSGLTIPRPIVDLDGVIFQCALFGEDRMIYGTKTRLIVFPSEF